MTVDELKSRLLEAEAEDADRAAIYDEVTTAYGDAVSRLDEATAKIEDLTDKVSQLTDTNFKLLEKIRYVDGEESKEEAEEIVTTVEELFAED